MRDGWERREVGVQRVLPGLPDDFVGDEGAELEKGEVGGEGRVEDVEALGAEVLFVL